ncbi:hypothetical protein KI688_005268 [Linnemannia hyalina]|uniref:Uncharacterized protein n=1 Tax=Linnemannia hyalina TaxID=64524 RepID=A0A9P7XLL4_9FUNG|nr:hypothetical protein KI688_005268 [Linnemannia hyalina]
MTIRPFKQVDQDAAAGNDPTFPSALGKDNQLLRSLDISSQPLPTLPRVSLSVFLKNVPKSAIKAKLPRPQQRIEYMALMAGVHWYAKE